MEKEITIYKLVFRKLIVSSIIMLISGKGFSQNFAEHVIYMELASGYDVRTLVQGDIDGDGDVDFVDCNGAFLNTSNSRRSVTIIYYNDGNGTFAIKRILPNVKANEITLGDLDQDRDLEIIGALEHMNQLVYFNNLGNGLFSDAIVIDQFIDAVNAVSSG